MAAIPLHYYGGSSLDFDLGADRSVFGELDEIQSVQCQVSIFQLSMRRCRAEAKSEGEVRAAMTESEISVLLDGHDAVLEQGIDIDGSQHAGPILTLREWAVC